MPHIHIDYSPNLEARLDIAALCRALRDAAVETGVLPPAGIRVRATACTHVVIADGNPDHAFLDISLRLSAHDDGPKRARDALSDLGVHLVCVSHLPKTYLDGAALRGIDGGGRSGRCADLTLRSHR
jgi:5-carboxymethyl-2-hydroxymuconate isomerase